MDLLTIAGAVIGGLLSVLNAFHWNKIKDQDAVSKDLGNKLTQAEKDINMAHSKIAVLVAETATKAQLNETVEKVRKDIKDEFDRNEQRQEKRETYLKEALDRMQDMLVDLAKRIGN